MSIVKWEPLKELSLLQERMNRIFEDTFLGHSQGKENLWDQGVWSPVVDIYESKDFLVLKAEIPGIDQKDIQLEIKENILTLKGERKLEQESKRENYHRLERSYGNFQRSFTLPPTIIAEKVSAAYKNGVLEVTIPKNEGVKGRKIEIKEE
jgi:HSP20 family protein